MSTRDGDFTIRCAHLASPKPLARMLAAETWSGREFGSRHLGLATAAVAALGLSRSLPQVLFGAKVEVFFALGAAEIIRLAIMLGLSSGVCRVYVHAAYRVFHCYCVIHLWPRCWCQIERTSRHWCFSEQKRSPSPRSLDVISEPVKISHLRYQEPDYNAVNGCRPVRPVGN